MKILITNDDGIHAKGILTLFETLSKKHQVTMIAPHIERSSCGHGITLGEPVRLQKTDDHMYSCSGLPADCILIGLGHVLLEDRPDLVISGINHGANLGQDRFYSGTMAAAREAAYRGIPSIAVSLVTKNGDANTHFDVAANYLQELIEKNVQEHIPPMSMLNINVPNLPAEEIAGYKDSFAGFQVYSEKVLDRVDGRGKDYFWIGGVHGGHRDIAGSDCNWVSQGYVSLDLHDVSGRCTKYSNQISELLKKF